VLCSDPPTPPASLRRRELHFAQGPRHPRARRPLTEPPGGTVPHGLLSTLKAMSMPDAGPAYVSLSSQNEATTVIDGLTIVTESYQDSPTSGRAVTVTLR